MYISRTWTSRGRRPGVNLRSLQLRTSQDALGYDADRTRESVFSDVRRTMIDVAVTSKFHCTMTPFRWSGEVLTRLRDTLEMAWGSS